ncbi:hypothetical protein [Mesorhizobium carmichaelinearum]|uniref:hypothetical protein n=1 Tax=Mesorhizobium carmichaelinearum TaxID=1208188 RepID=UPI003F6DB41C
MIRKLVLSSVIAVTCAAAAVYPANAGGVIIGFGSGYGDDYGDNYDYYGDSDRYPDYYGQGYSQYDDMYDNGYRPRYYHRHHRPHCRVVLIKHWRHHHRVIERVRICRR